VITSYFAYEQVILPLGLQREVDAHLRAYVSQKPMNRGNLSDNSLSRSDGVGSVSNPFYEQQEPLIQNSVAMEKILRRRSLPLRDKQQEWQVYLKPANFLEYFAFAVVILPVSSDLFFFNIYYLF
jgi:ATP-dependent RNA helicase DHX36